MIIYESTTTMSGFQPTPKRKRGQMNLYYVSMDCRSKDDVNANGVYGLKYAKHGGVMYVRAKSEKEAEEKAMAEVAKGIEPHYVSVGGEQIPSPERVTFNFANIQEIPFVD